jgi:peptidoglycan/xylan/chitin deacetylase (PgdA/CDA1 family)
MNFRMKVSTASICLLFYFSVSCFTPIRIYGQVTVKKWADDKKSAFSFTFDDGCMSQYTYATPVLDSFKFKGTFFVISNDMTDDLPGIERFGTWKQFRAMALEGHEIGSHTVTHPDLTTLAIGNISKQGTLLYELYHSQLTINQKITNQKCITISYPDLAYDTTVLVNTMLYYESARGGGDIPTYSSLTGSWFYKINGREEYFTTPRDSTQDDLDELQAFETYMQGAINDGTWGVLGAHEVVPFSQIPQLVANGEWYPMSTEWLTSLCQWMKQKSDSNQVWVETMGNITRYMKEREQFHYSITLQTATQIQISVTDNLSNQIYNYPLTVDITVPSNWQWAIVTQGSVKDTIKTFISGANTYVRTYVIPDGGTLILNKTDPPMPVEIASFTVAVKIKGVHLAWMTSTEINNSRFDIERIMDNKSWIKIGSLPGAGNSNSPKDYSFIDNSLLSKGKYSYRLKQVDNDGNYKYSGTVEVEVTFAPGTYSLSQNFPNPFNPGTKIHYEISSKEFVTLKVYDILGNEIETLVNEEKPLGAYELTWNAANLPGGVYFYKIQAGSFTEAKKMLLLK